MEVRDLIFLNDDFRGALDRYIGAKMRTKLAQLGFCLYEVCKKADGLEGTVC
jgi:hypothetical protein